MDASILKQGRVAPVDTLFSIRDLRFLDFLSYPDLEIKAGQTVFIQGESGSGKTSLLRLLNGSKSPSAGQVSFQGQDIALLDPLELRRKAILVAQEAWLFPGSIKDNFRLFGEARGLPAPQEEEIRKLLSVCALDLPLETNTGTMSGGERQRAFLAVCLSFAPVALLMDEPTSALDDQTAEVLFERLTAFAAQQGISLVAVSHSRALAEKFAQQVITLSGRARA